MRERGRLDRIFSFVFLTGLQDYKITGLTGFLNDKLKKSKLETIVIRI
ncbi:MAG: hypothetical protein LBE18_10355 [Planctomycetaceae bacterium]|nr:hypothetical protein [Planctomycetaceae bacterium]